MSAKYDLSLSPRTRQGGNEGGWERATGRDMGRGRGSPRKHPLRGLPHRASVTGGCPIHSVHGLRRVGLMSAAYLDRDLSMDVRTGTGLLLFMAARPRGRRDWYADDAALAAAVEAERLAAVDAGFPGTF